MGELASPMMAFGPAAVVLLAVIWVFFALGLLAGACGVLCWVWGIIRE